MRHKLTIAMIGALAVCMASAFAQKPGNNGTTVSAYKTLDVCKVDDSTWRYSGVISIWNQGALDTVGLQIDDWIQTKMPGGQYFNFLKVASFTPALHEIPAGMATAATFKYSVEGAKLNPLYIRNVANITILNHSNYLGTPFGPSPKASWTGEEPAACEGNYGCTYTQGYWGSKPDVAWPSPYSRDAVFFLSGQTWQQVMDTPVNASQGYYQLAHQYIAAVLNVANGASAPAGVQAILDQAATWFTMNGPGACVAAGSCGAQKTWAGVLDEYNNGLYPGGPGHCGQ